MGAGELARAHEASCFQTVVSNHQKARRDASPHHGRSGDVSPPRWRLSIPDRFLQRRLSFQHLPPRRGRFPQGLAPNNMSQTAERERAKLPNENEPNCRMTIDERGVNLL